MGSGPGACIVADPHSGQILAMESQPWVDPNRVDDQAYWDAMRARSDRPFVNRAIQGTYAPGSIFKTVTLSAAYDTGAYDVSSVLSGQDATGPLYVDGYLLRSDINNLPPGVESVTTVDAFKYSDNIAFATIGMALGPRVLLDYSARFGFGQSIPFELPVHPSSFSDHPGTLSRLDVAVSAFGQGHVQVTPLQMLLVAEAVANGGVEPRPYVVSQITAPNGEVLQQTGPGTWQQPISAATAAKVTQAMAAVVQSPGGSGYMARVPGVTVAGKTGTAQTPSGQPHAWFLAFAPVDHPRLAVIVFKENGGEGYSQAAPIAGSILRQALPLLK
jgi:peptidoglycan glycosyltransferase